MLNGTGNLMEITTTATHSGAMENETQYFVKFNFGLTWGHVVKAATVAAAAIAALAAAGWLAVPASQTALDKITVQLIETNKQVVELQGAVKALTEAVGTLNDVVGRVSQMRSKPR